MAKAVFLGANQKNGVVISHLASYGFFTTKKNPEDPKKDQLQRQRHVLVLLAMTRRKSNINYV